MSYGLERTLAILKPDTADKEEEIEELIRQNGFMILQKRRVLLSPEEASEFYEEHFGKPFFHDLIAYITSGQVVAMVLSKENAIEAWRYLIGPFKVSEAKEKQPDSLRAQYGTDDTCNGFHGSDSHASADREIRFFFPGAIIDPIMTGQAAKDYLAQTVNPTLLKGLTQLCKHKPNDPVIWLADWLLLNNPNKPHIDDLQGNMEI